MTEQEQTYLSADSHVLEPGDLWVKEASPGWKDRMPRVETEGGSSTFAGEGIGAMPLAVTFAAGKRGEEMTYDGLTWDDRPAAGYDVGARMEAMREDGVSGEVLYPTLGLYLYRLADKEAKREALRLYNGWLADLVGRSEGRLLGVGMVSVDTPETLPEDIAAIKEQGHRAIMAPVVPGEVPYNDKSYEPLWATAAEAGLPISFHLGTGADVIRRRGPGAGGINYLMGLEDAQQLCHTLIWAGVYQRHPSLRVTIVEAGIGWIAPLLDKLDDVWEQHRGWMKPKLDRPPSDYFRRHCNATFERDQIGLMTRAIPGVDTLMWATDYPHAESSWPRSREIAEEHFKDLSAEEQNAITSGNVRRLYGWDIPA